MCKRLYVVHDGVLLIMGQYFVIHYPKRLFNVKYTHKYPGEQE